MLLNQMKNMNEGITGTIVTFEKYNKLDANSEMIEKTSA